MIINSFKFQVSGYWNYKFRTLSENDDVLNITEKENQRHPTNSWNLQLSQEDNSDGNR